MHLPLCIYDVDLYRFITHLKIEGPFWTQIGVQDEHCFKGFLTEIGSIAVPDHYSKNILNTFLSEFFEITEQNIPHLSILDDEFILNDIQHLNHPYFKKTLVWQSKNQWPLGFSVIFQSLSELYMAAYQNRKQELEIYPEGIIILSLNGRNWPREIYNDIIGIAEFRAGGNDIPSTLLNTLTFTKAHDEDTNVEAFIRMGYDRETALEFHQSGLIAIPDEEILEYVGSLNISSLGGLPINEFNAINPPNYSSITRGRKELNGFFIDKYYQTPFVSLWPESIGLHGINNKLFRDHFDDFRKDLNIIGSVRSKHYAIPVLEVDNLEELKRLIDKIPIFPELGSDVYYRGQSQPYYLNRAKSVQHLLFGKDDVFEPSLLGAAQRRGLNYEEVHSLLQLFVQDYIYKSAFEQGENLEDVHKEWLDIASSPTAIWDTAVMALAQHYGIPTHGLDITSSIEVAVWFATNRFVQFEDGMAMYKQMKAEDWPKDPKYWPVVYFIKPVTNSIEPSIWHIDSLNKLHINALRPERQKAHFFMGSQGVHQNRLAEALVCQVRLRPGNYDTGLTYNYLFPNHDEDPVFKLMLKLKNMFSREELGEFFKEIVAYK